MKLTKQKLEQLIKESIKESKTYIQVAGDLGMQTGNPEFHDKLARLYTQDRNQASQLADTLDEPIFLELPDDPPETIVDNIYLNQFQHYSKLRPNPSYAPVGGWIEIYLNQDVDGSIADRVTYEDWFVNFYPTDYNGVNVFDANLSKQFSNSQDAIDYYNQHAVEEYPESNPLRKNTDYTHHPDNPYTKKDTNFS